MRPYPAVPIWMRPIDWEWNRSSIPYTRQEWTPAEEKILLTMSGDGAALGEVAKVLGRTYSSVRCKHRKLRGGNGLQLLQE